MAIWGLILGVVAVMVGPGVAVEQGYAQLTGHIQVLSTSHVVDFPSSVKFKLEVRSPNEISEIQLFYRLGNQSITTYGYPQFNQASLVNAEFVLETDGDGFLPQGVLISYSYLITDSSGQQVRTEEYSVEFLDASKNWQRLRVGDMELLFHDRPAAGVESVAKDIGDSLNDVKRVLGIDFVTPQKAVILNGGQEVRQSFPLISQTATDRHVYGGFAFGDMDVFVLADLDKDGMIHEMTHLYLDEVLRGKGTRVPAWLNEGLAMYFEAGDKGRDRMVSRASLSGRLLPLRSMGRVPGKPDDVNLFYAQSWSLVTYLMESHDEETMSGLLLSLQRGQNFESAFSDNYGFALDELDTRWRSSVRRGAAISSLPDPGTLGTSVIIAGAMAFAMVVVLIGRFRRQEVPYEEEDVDFHQ